MTPETRRLLKQAVDARRRQLDGKAVREDCAYCGKPLVDLGYRGLRKYCSETHRRSAWKNSEAGREWMRRGAERRKLARRAKRLEAAA